MPVNADVLENEAKNLRELACTLRKVAGEIPDRVELDPHKVRDFLVFYGGIRNATD